MSFLRNGALGVLLAAAAWCASPATGEAQYGYQCVDNSQCPTGSVCVGGSCAYAQQYPQGQVQVQGGYGQPGVQVQGGYQQPQYYQPQPQPPPPRQAREEERMRLGLLIPGIVGLVGGYAGNVLAGLFAGFSFWGSSTDEWSTFRFLSLIPLAGPWIQLGFLPDTVDGDSWYTWLIIDGLLQAAGLTLIVLAATLKERVTVYSEGGPGGLELAVVPHAGPTFGGLSLLGRF